MRYVLAIGLETEIYKNPRLEVFLNNRFLGMTEIDESVSAEIQHHKKSDLLDAWNYGPYSDHERKYKITMPKKWIIYELDDSDFNKDNTLDIVPKNLETNNMNGFVTKMDKCKIFDVMLLPKDWFGSEGVQKIFKHCDGRNVVIEFEHGNGWPNITTPKDNHELYPVYNSSSSCNIIYDEILELYVIKNASYIPNIPIHLTIDKYFEFEGTKNDPKIYACHPQQLFENNNDTTVLFVNNAVKLQLDQIATKYQHNEN